MIGVVAKPVTGVFDLVGKTAEGMKNTATINDDKPNEKRMRICRAFYLNKYYRNFDKDDSEFYHYLIILRKNYSGFVDSLY